MSTKLYFIGEAAPTPTTGSDVAKSAPLTPAELDQIHANLRWSVDRIVAEAANQAEEDALFAAGYRLIVRTDLIDGYVPTSVPPTASVTMTMVAALQPMTTIVMTF